MKTLLSILLVAAFGAVALADVQDPPMNDFGPTRKLGRGIANVLYGITELPYCIANINELEGNSAGCSYGIVKGLGRTFYRFGKGWYEIATFPVPTYKASYRPPYPSQIPWVHGGYTEFPPELGFETRYSYVRDYEPLQ